LTKDIILYLATKTGGFRHNTPIYSQFETEPDKRYLKVSSGSVQGIHGGKNATKPSTLVWKALQGDEPPKFDIIPVQAPSCTKETPEGDDDEYWEKYIYVISPVVATHHTSSYLGHMRRKKGTPDDRNHLLVSREWTQNSAATDAGWILFRPKNRIGFHLLRTLDMGRTASKATQIDENEIEVLAFTNAIMPPKYACGRRCEIGGSEGLFFRSFKDPNWRDFPFNEE